MITRRVEVAQGRYARVAGVLVEPPRPHVAVPRRRLDVEVAAAPSGNRALDLLEKTAAHTLPLRRRRDDDPIQIERPLRQRRLAPGRVTQHRAVPFREEKRVAALRPLREARFKQLERDGAFLAV